MKLLLMLQGVLFLCFSSAHPQSSLSDGSSWFSNDGITNLGSGISSTISEVNTLFTNGVKTAKQVLGMPILCQEDLDRLAAEELLKEAGELKKFAEIEGPMAWKQKRIGKTNKIFLQQTIKSAVLANNRKNLKKD